MRADKRASVWPSFCCSPAHAVAPQQLQQLLAQRRRLCMEAHWLMHAMHYGKPAGLRINNALSLMPGVCKMQAFDQSSLEGVQPQGAKWLHAGATMSRANTT